MQTQTVKSGLAGRFRKALIVEDDDHLRSVLARLVASWGCDVMEGRSIAEGAALLTARPDLVVMDVRLPDGSAVEMAEASREIDPPPLVVAISGVASAAEAFELAKAGVRAFLPKPFSQREFERRIGWALDESGDSSLPPELRAAMEVNFQRLTEQRGLSERQSEVVRLVMAGVPRADFAERLGVTENTCKTTVRRVLRKCNARRLSDLSRLLLTLPPERGG